MGGLLGSDSELGMVLKNYWRCTELPFVVSGIVKGVSLITWPKPYLCYGYVRSVGSLQRSLQSRSLSWVLYLSSITVFCCPPLPFEDTKRLVINPSCSTDLEEKVPNELT